ncbi:MAG: metallopeptidase family protein [Chloroflexi bacterium]|jgi:predicted Zn-dependent protease with MMP-like domain|nr:metallopeptidase family protein [Chloroflexota bacterium]MDQ3407385.1 metallopeptidase family protein [Chloroflexota bacterium]
MPIRRRGTLARRNAHRRVDLPELRHEPFERLVQRALDELPMPFRALLENVAVVIEDEPTHDQLSYGGGDPDGTLYGLYEGTPGIEYGADWAPFPNKITLFRFALEEDFPDPSDLADEVQATVVHELAHHAGIEEDRLHELGWG